VIINIFTHSAEQTFRSAYVIGQSICGPRIFLIEGSLGVGKTVFCKGLICGLGLENSNDVTSPSFTLINEYLLRIPVFHVDLYRINNRRDLETLGLEEILGQAAVILVEWPEKLEEDELENATQVCIIDLGGEDRRIELNQPAKVGSLQARTTETDDLVSYDRTSFMTAGIE